MQSQGEFVQIDADSNELSIKQYSPRKSSRDHNAKNRESDRVSLSRAISLYRASMNNSTQSSMKGTRWAFGSKLEGGGGGRFIFMPHESIKVKYRVLEMVQATAYGDAFRIQIQQKPFEDKGGNKKSVSSKSVNVSVPPELKDKKNGENSEEI